MVTAILIIIGIVFGGLAVLYIIGLVSLTRKARRDKEAYLVRARMEKRAAELRSVKASRAVKTELTPRINQRHDTPYAIYTETVSDDFKVTYRIGVEESNFETPTHHRDAPEHGGGGDFSGGGSSDSWEGSDSGSSGGSDSGSSND